MKAVVTALALVFLVRDVSGAVTIQSIKRDHPDIMEFKNIPIAIQNPRWLVQPDIFVVERKVSEKDLLGQWLYSSGTSINACVQADGFVDTKKPPRCTGHYIIFEFFEDHVFRSRIIATINDMGVELTKVERRVIVGSYEVRNSVILMTAIANHMTITDWYGKVTTRDMPTTDMRFTMGMGPVKEHFSPKKGEGLIFDGRCFSETHCYCTYVDYMRKGFAGYILQKM